MINFSKISQNLLQSHDVTILLQSNGKQALAFLIDSFHSGHTLKLVWNIWQYEPHTSLIRAQYLEIIRLLIMLIPCFNFFLFFAFADTMFWVNLTDRNFFARPPTYVNLKHNIISSLDELTLCAWVKTSNSIRPGASIIHYGDSKDHNCNDIALVYNKSLSYEGFSFLISNTHARVNFSLLDGRPHHLCVTWQNNGLWNAFQDGTKVSSGSELKNLNGKSIEANGWLVIGQDISIERIGADTYRCTPFRPNSLFVGSVSQVYLWNTILDSNLLYLLYSNCTIPAMDKLLLRWSVTKL